MKRKKMIEKHLDPLIEIVLAILMAVTICTVFTGVVFRYVLLSPLAWTEEIARLCLVWMTFLGAYIAMRRDKHMYIQLFYDRFSLHWKKKIDIIGNAFLISFYILLIIYGNKYANAFMSDLSPYLEIPLGVSYMALPIAAFLLLIGTISRIYHMITSYHPDQRDSE